MVPMYSAAQYELSCLSVSKNLSLFLNLNDHTICVTIHKPTIPTKIE